MYILTLCVLLLLTNFSLWCVDLVHSCLSALPTRRVPLKQVLAIVLQIFQSRGVLVTLSKTLDLLMHIQDPFIV